MRIAIGEFAHETNTFCSGMTEVEDFKARHWLAGEEIPARHRSVRDYLGGMIAAGEQLGIEIVPTFATSTEPSATISRRAYATIRDELIAGIRAAGAIDALCLSLHGAGVAEGADDLEGTLLGEIRGVVGAQLPIVVTLDLHGNMTHAMVAQADALLNCHLYPHTDCFERGQEAVELAAKIVRGEVRPVMHLEVLPATIPPSTTMHGPARTINELCFEWEAAPGMLDCAFVHGFPHTDIPGIQTTVLATTDGDPALAERAAKAVARRVWETRAAFLAELPGAAEAVRQALASDARPVVIAEVSDNPGGGSPGDGTHLLRALLAADAPETCFGFIFDPEVARQAHAAGPGATVAARLGGKTDTLHGEPIEAPAYVKCLTDGRFVYSTTMGAGARVDLGPMARLVIGNVDVLVSSVRTQTLDQEVFLLHGIDVTRYRVVALKSQQHFRAGFEHLAGAIIRCDTPGATSSNLATLPFIRIQRPIWPLDREVGYDPLPNSV
jgi:microcystin degradation protein MlrC